MTTLQAIDLTRRFADFLALDAVSLSVPERSVYGFLGPNGAGKTTTIRCILGLIRADAGQVRIAGHDLARNRAQALASVGAVVETPALFKNLTGRENLDVTARLIQADSRAIDRVLEIVDLRQASGRKVAHYSLGMRQRLGIARALLGRPRLLILDEPTNGLDPAGIRDMRQLIRSLPEREGTTVFMSSHLLSEVEQTATHLALMRAGRIIFEGEIGALAEHRPGHVHIDTDDDVRAAELAGAQGLTAIPRSDGGLALRSAAPLTRERLAALNADLVAAGLQVSRLSLEHGDLESVFIKLTGATAGDAA
ncbi:ABC transporter ATP-binding protein [Maricaulis sp.]|uniref:ABC transporter ATP-binding protein n=1 Tax=Maricaulis sp. TaxID=1486257 RepID=UPI00261BA92F|nr:ABC transporter ATP-binding protein [Maricaulis sp.]